MSSICKSARSYEPHFIPQEMEVFMDLEHFLKIHAIHMALDGICFTAEGFLKPLPGSVPDKIQRLYLAQHDNGFLRCFREDLPSSSTPSKFLMTPKLSRLSWLKTLPVKQSGKEKATSSQTRSLQKIFRMSFNWTQRTNLNLSSSRQVRP